MIVLGAGLNPGRRSVLMRVWAAYLFDLGVLFLYVYVCMWHITHTVEERGA